MLCAITCLYSMLIWMPIHNCMFILIKCIVYVKINQYQTNYLVFHFSLWILDIWISKYNLLTTLTENYHKWDKSDYSQIHTANVQVLQPRINTTTQRSRQENVNSSRILEAVLTMVQQRYSMSGGAFRKRGLRTSTSIKKFALVYYLQVTIL